MIRGRIKIIWPRIVLYFNPPLYCQLWYHRRVRKKLLRQGYASGMCNRCACCVDSGLWDQNPLES